MSENLNGLFSTTVKDAANSSARSLAGTAQLTNIAMSTANEIIKTLEADFESYVDAIAASKTNHNAMDALIMKAYDLQTIDTTFLKEIDSDVLEGMLKSQQSKRSRAKGKVMTMDNYRNMMVGALGELLIRQATGQTKSLNVGFRNTTTAEFTPEQLLEMEADQERVRRELRNVQSKKSIAKSKEGFSEDDEKWHLLLRIEAQLKGIRDTTARTVVIDETKNKLSGLLNGVDTKNLKPADARSLIERALELIQPAVTPEVNSDEE